MARSAVVFSNSIVADKWVNQSVPHARNSDYSLYYRNDTIYSFGAHYPVASFIRKDGGGFYGDCIFLNNIKSHSMTTGSHSSVVSYAIRKHNLWSMDRILLSGYHVFHVRLSKYRKPYERHLDLILKDYQEDINNLSLTAIRARVRHYQRWKLKEAYSKIYEAQRFANHFSLDFDATPTNIQENGLELARISLSIDVANSMDKFSEGTSEYYNY